MDKNKFISWVREIKEKLPKFISEIEDKNISGKYKLTLSGAPVSPNKHWGLVQSIFVTRIFFIIDKLDAQQKESILEYILTFCKKGAIYDENIKTFFKKENYSHDKRH